MKDLPFYKTYINDMGKLNGLSGGDCTILRECLKYMNYSNWLFINKPLMDKILKETGYSVIMFRKALAKFVESGIFGKPVKTRGKYKVNPNLFGRGDSSAMCKIRMYTEYTDEGRMIVTIFDPKNPMPRPVPSSSNGVHKNIEDIPLDHFDLQNPS